MATEQQKRDAAKIPPSQRTVAEQRLVSDNPSQAVRNLDFEARRNDRKG